MRSAGAPLHRAVPRRRGADPRPEVRGRCPAPYTSEKTVYHDFRQIRGIGRASARQTALITVNITPERADHVRITAPFLGHATHAEVAFENRTVPVKDGVIVDSFAGGYADVSTRWTACRRASVPGRRHASAAPTSPAPGPHGGDRVNSASAPASNESSTRIGGPLLATERRKTPRAGMQRSSGI